MEADGLPAIEPAGDQAFLVRFGNEISPALGERVFAAASALDRNRPPWLVDLVPAYASLLAVFDAAAVAPETVSAWIRDAIARPATAAAPHRKVIVPVVYGGEAGRDLEEVARETGLSEDAVVACHVGRDYLVYMLGFKPGFPYMGILPERLRLPRLRVPRTRVPAGSVGIAGLQTGIYPVESPGGWRIIGRTTLRLFDPSKEEPFLFRPGDQVRFERV